jgi:hypothetical protein
MNKTKKSKRLQRSAKQSEIAILRILLDHIFGRKKG